MEPIILSRLNNTIILSRLDYTGPNIPGVWLAASLSTLWKYRDLFGATIAAIRKERGEI